MCHFRASTSHRWVVAELLVALLTGVFDPPPDAVSIAWSYIAILAGTCLLATFAAIDVCGRR
jgi:putative ABC transport system permease protein